MSDGATSPVLVTALGAGLLALTGAAAWGSGSARPPPIDLYMVLMAAVFAVYVALTQIVLRNALTRRTMQWLMLTAVLARGVMLAAPHRRNSDVARFLWDGHLLVHGCNPYAYVPDDPALDAVRDSGFYAPLNPAHNHIRTVYGPLAQVFFGVAARFAGPAPDAVRVLVTIGDVLTIALVVMLLRQTGLPEQWALVYALNPLVIDSFAQRGQVDGLLLPCLALAVLFAGRRRYASAGAALAAAMLVKVVAVLLVPVVLFLSLRRGGRQSACRFLGTLAAVLAVGILPFAGAGTAALTGLATFAQQWRGNAFLFAMVEALCGARAAQAVAVLGVGVALSASAVAWTTPLRAQTPCSEVYPLSPPTAQIACRVGLVFFVLLLFAPVVFPWYVTWLLPFSPFLIGSREWKWIGYAIVCWSGTVFLWYFRFLTPPATALVQWEQLATAARYIPGLAIEPWRLVEYAPVVVLVGIGLGHLRCRSADFLRGDGPVSCLRDDVPEHREEVADASCEHK